MTFYQQLSTHYDTVFAAKPAEMRLIRNLVAGRRRLLDIGCGTGNKTELLLDKDVSIVAIDSDSGMIESAAARHKHPGIDYRQMDMMNIGAGFAPGAFDGALCLGNTLAHLAGPERLEAFLENVATVLEPQGMFVAQILNYDRIIDKGVLGLPDIVTPEVRFYRRYEWRDGDMHFLTRIETPADDSRFDNDIVLYPFRKEELVQALTNAGFGTTDLYGGYDGSAYTDDSFHLITASWKK